MLRADQACADEGRGGVPADEALVVRAAAELLAGDAAFRVRALAADQAFGQAGDELRSAAGAMLLEAGASIETIARIHNAQEEDVYEHAAAG